MSDDIDRAHAERQALPIAIGDAVWTNTSLCIVESLLDRVDQAQIHVRSGRTGLVRTYRTTDGAATDGTDESVHPDDLVRIKRDLLPASVDEKKIPVADLRTGPGFRVRCLADDGTTGHVAVDLHGCIDLMRFACALKALGRCACGAQLHMIDADAAEPKDANAARKAHDESAEGGTVEQCTRMKWRRSSDALRALFADGRERTNRAVADALGVGDAAAAQLLRRSSVVERMRQGVWRLRAQEGATDERR